MHLLTFAIPTWKRPKYLEKCVRSIASQVRDGRTRILISEDRDDPETTEVIAQLVSEYAFIDVTVHDPRRDYSDNFLHLFSRATGEWTWMMGDDDFLRPGALGFMLEHLEKQTDIQFIHVAEETRASGEQGLHHGTLWTLCNAYGWIEMTGFITGNVVRSARLRHACETKWWRFYAKTAFVQSCILMEELKDEPAAFMDLGLVGSQDPGQTPETAARWHADNISGRYIYIADVVELMFEEGIIKNRLSNAFFRYLNLNLWNRYTAYFTDDYLRDGTLYMEEMWSKVMKLATFLEDIEHAKKVIAEIEAARGLVTLHSYWKRSIEGIDGEIKLILARNQVDVYPFTYVKPKEAA